MRPIKVFVLLLVAAGLITSFASTDWIYQSGFSPVTDSPWAGGWARIKRASFLPGPAYVDLVVVNCPSQGDLETIRSTLSNYAPHEPTAQPLPALLDVHLIEVARLVINRERPWESQGEIAVTLQRVVPRLLEQNTAALAICANCSVGQLEDCISFVAGKREATSWSEPGSVEYLEVPCANYPR